MQCKTSLFYVGKGLLKKVVVTIFIKHFSYFYIFLFKRRNSLQHQIHFFVKGYKNNFFIDTTSILNCKQMLNYKMNLLSRIEYKCFVSNKSHINKERDKIYLLLKE